MSLKTGTLTLISEEGIETELKTAGKIFRIGSYISCDLVLDNPEARNIHCEIQSDSFGRITITNHSKSNPVRINGIPLKGTRPLYTGSVISIFEKSLKWVNKHRLPRNIIDMDKNQTPKLGFKRTDQAPNSEPSAPMRRRHAKKRVTMHNFGASNCLVDEDDVDTMRDGNDENKHQDRLTRASIMSAAKSFGATPPRSACRSKILSRRSVDAKNVLEDYSFKENKMNDTPETKKLCLLKCQYTATVVTSYSPGATPKRTPNSFAYVTPKSAYGTPRSALSLLNGDEVKSVCSTPKTPTDICNMHLIDLTTPDVYKTPLQKRTPLFRSALKNSAVKSVSKAVAKEDPNSTLKSCTPSSNKKIRWNTSNLTIKTEKEQTPMQMTLNKSTPFRKSALTPNKPKPSSAQSIGKKMHNCLRQSISETPPSLTRQRTLTAGSVRSGRSISKVTPVLKRKSLNTSLPLKTPKEIFSSVTPVNSRRSSIRTPIVGKSVLMKEASAKKDQIMTSASILDRSKTFIVDSPSISQVNKSNNIPNVANEQIDENTANDTFTCDEDSESGITEQSETSESTRKSISRVSEVTKESGCPEVNVTEEELLDFTKSEGGNQIDSSSPSSKNVSLVKTESSKSFNSSTHYEKDVNFPGDASDTPIDNIKLVEYKQDEVEDTSKQIIQKEMIVDNNKLVAEVDEVVLAQRNVICNFVEVLNNSSEMSFSNETFDKSAHSLNDTFSKTEQDKMLETPPQRKSLGRRSGKENELNKNTTNVTGNANSLIISEERQENRRKSMRLSRTNTDIQSISTEVTVEEDKSNTLGQSKGVIRGVKKTNEENLERFEVVHSSPRLFGIKELLKTPKMRKNIELIGVKELMAEDKSTDLRNFVGTKELFNTPKQNDVSNFVGIKELIKTPVANPGLANLKGVKELFNTPTQNDLTNVIGVKELMNTPKLTVGLSDPKGIKELFNTPIRDDLTDVRGVKELVNTPARDDLTNVIGVKELVNTPRVERGLEDPKGIKELFNTPARDDLTDVFGVKELINTPKMIVGFDDAIGVRELFKTPIEKSGITDTRGMKELFRTPKEADGLDDAKGVKELLKTPQPTPDIRGGKSIKELFNTPAQNNLSDMKGVKELMKTPIENSPMLSGMRELLKTPYIPSYDETDGLNDVFKTPASRGVMVLSTPKSISIEKMSTSTGNILKTPKELNVLEDIEEVEEIFRTPVSNLNNSELSQNESNLNLSPEESFDKLVGKSSVRRTYGRKSITPRILPIPIASESHEGNPKTDIQEWIDHVDISQNIENPSKQDEKAIIKSPIVKLHRQPLATSSSIKPTMHRRSNRLSNICLKDNELNEMSGIEQLNDSFLSSSEISGVCAENNKIMSVEIDKEIANKSKASNSKTPLKSVQFVDSSLHAFKDTPQIRRLRNRVSTPYNKQVLPDDPFADLSIQYIDESSLSKSNVNNSSRYKIRRSGRTNDISLELIDSEGSFVNESAVVKRTLRNSTTDTEIDFVSLQDSPKKALSAKKKGRKSSKTTKSSCVISISEDEVISESLLSQEDKSISSMQRVSKIEKPSNKTDSKLLEFVATNELSKVSENGRRHSVDAFQSLNNESANVTLIDVEASQDDIKEISFPCAYSKNESAERSGSLQASVSYEEEEDKLLNLYCTQFSTNEGNSKTLEIVYVDSQIENTTTFENGGGIDLSVISTKSLSQSKNYSLKAADVESCVDETILATPKPQSTAVDIMATESSRIQESKTFLCDSSTKQDLETNNSLNDTANRTNEFENFVANLEVKQRILGRSLTPARNNNLGLKEKAKRKTLGASANSAPIDLKSEKLRLEFSNFDVNPKVMLTRGTSQLEMRPSRMTVTRRTTGKLPLNPHFDLEDEKARRKLSMEFENFNAGPRRSLRGYSLSPVKKKKEERERRTLGQKPLGNESFDYQYEVERRNMSMEFSQFEAFPSKRHNLRNRSSALISKKTDSKSTKNRFTLGQQSENTFDYDGELDRRNMSLEFEHFQADAPIPTDSRRLSVVTQHPSNSRANVRLSEGHKVSDSKFDLKAEQERRKLSLEFRNFDINPTKKPHTRGYSEIFDSSDAVSDRMNNRKTLGGQPSNNSFDVEREVEKYNFEREFENFDPEGDLAKHHRGHSQSPVKKSEMHNLTNKRLTVGHPPLNEYFDLEAEKKRKELENLDPIPVQRPIRGMSLSPSGKEDKSDIACKKRMTFGDKSNSVFDVEAEKKLLGQKEHCKTNESLQEETCKQIEKFDATSLERQVIELEEIVNASEQENMPEIKIDEDKITTPENEHILDSSSKDTLNRNDNEDLYPGDNGRERHVRFGENIYYEISLLDSYATAESDNKKSRNGRKQKTFVVGEANENAKLTERSRSRRNKKTEENDLITEASSPNPDDDLSDVANQGKVYHHSEIKQENSKTRRGRRIVNLIQQNGKKSKEYSASVDTKTLDLEKNPHSEEALDSTEGIECNKPNFVQTCEQIATSQEPVSKETFVFEENVTSGGIPRSRRGTRAAATKATKKIAALTSEAQEDENTTTTVRSKDSATVDSESSSQEKNALPDKALISFEGKIEETTLSQKSMIGVAASVKENTTTEISRSRRGTRAAATKATKKIGTLVSEGENAPNESAKDESSGKKSQSRSTNLTGKTVQNEDKNLKAEYDGTVLQDPALIDLDSSKVENLHEKQQQIRSQDEKGMPVEKNSQSRRPRNRTNKHVANISDKTSEIPLTTETLNEKHEHHKSSDSEIISFINGNQAESNLGEATEEHEEKVAKMRRVRKVAPTSFEVRSSPRTARRINSENIQERDTGEEQRNPKTTTSASSSKTPIIEIASPEGEDSHEESSLPNRPTRNTRQKAPASTVNKTDPLSLKRSRRLVSIDVETERNSENILTENSSSTEVRNLKRSPLMETDPFDTKSSADILPAKRTRRLASNSETILNQAQSSSSQSKPKPRGRGLRSKANKENKDNEDHIDEVTENEVIVKIPGETKRELESTPLKSESSDKDPSRGHASNVDLVRAKTRRLLSVDEQLAKDPESLNVESPAKAVPAKRAKRLASSNDPDINNPKPKGKGGHGKTNLKNKENINDKLELASNNSDIVSKQIQTEYSESDRLLKISDKENRSIPEGSYPKQVTKQQQQDLQEDGQSRSTRNRGNKETKSNSQINVPEAPKENESSNAEFGNDEIVFKTPNEIKPKRRGGRLTSTNETPTEDSSKAESIVPPRRTRRLISTEEAIEKSNATSTVKESSETERLEKPQLRRKVTAKTEAPALQVEENFDDPVYQKSRTTHLSSKQSTNVPEKTPEKSTSNPPKRGRPAKRKVENAEEAFQTEKNVYDSVEQKSTTPNLLSKPSNSDTEMTQEEFASKTSKRGRAAKRKLENAEETYSVEKNIDDPVEKKSTTSNLLSKQSNSEPQLSQEESASKTSKRGRPPKRKVESVEVNTNEVVTRTTRSRRK